MSTTDANSTPTILPIDQIVGLDDLEREFIRQVRLSDAKSPAQFTSDKSLPIGSRPGYTLARKTIPYSTHAEPLSDDGTIIDFYEAQRALRCAWAVVGKLIGIGSIRVDMGGAPEDWANDLLIEVLAVQEIITYEYQ